jgi:hypothetical protein
MPGNVDVYERVTPIGEGADVAMVQAGDFNTIRR